MLTAIIIVGTPELAELTGSSYVTRGFSCELKASSVEELAVSIVDLISLLRPSLPRGASVRIYVIEDSKRVLEVLSGRVEFAGRVMRLKFRCVKSSKLARALTRYTTSDNET